MGNTAGHALFSSSPGVRTSCHLLFDYQSCLFSVCLSVWSSVVSQSGHCKSSQSLRKHLFLQKVLTNTSWRFVFSRGGRVTLNKDIQGEPQAEYVLSCYLFEISRENATPVDWKKNSCDTRFFKFRRLTKLI